MTEKLKIENEIIRVIQTWSSLFGAINKNDITRAVLVEILMQKNKTFIDEEAYNDEIFIDRLVDNMCVRGILIRENLGINILYNYRVATLKERIGLSKD